MQITNDVTAKKEIKWNEYATALIYKDSDKIHSAGTQLADVICI